MTTPRKGPALTTLILALLGWQESGEAAVHANAP